MEVQTGEESDDAELRFIEGACAGEPTVDRSTMDFVCVIVPTVVALLYYQREDLQDAIRDEVVRQRLSWNRHAEALLQEGQFKQYYRMSATSFEKLLRFIAPNLKIDRCQSERGTSGTKPLSRPGMLQACLRWLSGGHHHDIRVVTGISVSSFYRVVYRVMHAIRSRDELAISFPVSLAAIVKTAKGFASRSTDGLIQGCIGAIDGWLCPIQVPTASECGRVDSFFSGHYQQYGINVQAACDYNSRFTAFTVSCPGGMNDSVAFFQWSLSRFLANHSNGFFVVGDNAYTLASFLMTPFNKAQTSGNTDRDNYNFFISQLRIRIEMAFGLLVNKWRILKAPLRVRLENCARLIETCMILHNFCIDEANANNEIQDNGLSLFEEVRRLNMDTDISFTPSILQDDEDADDSAVGITYGEIARQNLVDHIASMNMHRPKRTTKTK